MTGRSESGSLRGPRAALGGTPITASTGGLGLLVAVALAGCSLFERPPEEPPPPPTPRPLEVEDAREPCVQRDPLRKAHFGDLHVHTSFSVDANVWDVRSDPAHAYAFARGESIALPPLDAQGRGTRSLQLERPLDFAAVTDHAETYGVTSVCTSPRAPQYGTAACRRYRGETLGVRVLGWMRGGDGAHLRLESLLGARAEICGESGVRCLGAAHDVWLETQQAAEAAYDRSSQCRFTSFVGYEYSAEERGSVLHRNVLFRNASVLPQPISAREAPAPRDLWHGLHAACIEGDPRCDVIAIPHNTNLSNGRAFRLDLPGVEGDEDLAALWRLRARIEPLVEIFQHQGDAECRDGLSGVEGAPDELCAFEKLRSTRDADGATDCGAGVGEGGLTDELGAAGCISRRDFARYALALGLAEEARSGANPFKLGVVAATGSRNATPGAVREPGFGGHSGIGDASAKGRMTATRRRFNPGGLAGVWAEENSRDSLFDALQRRETFGTSGPRIAPRFFGGWGYSADSCERSGLVDRGYAGGVPMGGDLPPRPADVAAPVFVAAALRDAGTSNFSGGSLERIQIVKAWSDAAGNVQQRVFDVAGEPGPPIDPSSCAPPEETKDSLCGVWTDPSFDPSVRAVYYARVLEVERCRYLWRECRALPERERPDACADLELPKTLRERAWTSPIWYAPEPSLEAAREPPPEPVRDDVVEAPREDPSEAAEE